MTFKYYIDLICSDLLGVFMGLFVFLIAWLSNFILSLYNNIGIKQEKFDKKRMLNGILKAVIIALGALLLVVAVDMAIIIFKLENSEAGTVVSIITIMLTIGTATTYYIYQAATSFKNILLPNEIQPVALEKE